MANSVLITDQFPGIDEAGIRLERVGGLTVWEASPVYKHQAAIVRIERSIRPSATAEQGCDCIWIPDVSLVFADGSQKRPDISIFCREPDEEEQESAITLIPEAVIEVISKGYEAKDYEVGVPFYLAQGVKDVVTFDPRSKEVRHYTSAGMLPLTSPVEIELASGCVCTV